ncbi:MAG: HK97 gp10 family phage protein [Methanobrevibacter woesei]|nr:HK97 gp10 family phage protein [Methanobrevibacter woesei]
MIDIKIDFSDAYFKKLGLKGAGYDKVVQNTLLTASVRAEETIRREAPVKTGNLRRSINHFTNGSTTGVLARGAPYWVNVEYGTSPHVITPVNADFLHFKIGNQDIFTKKVQHPGNKPNPFVKRSLNTMKSRGIFQECLRHSLSRNGMI